MPQRDTHGSILWHFLRPGQSTSTKRYYLNLFLSSNWWPNHALRVRQYTKELEKLATISHFPSVDYRVGQLK